MMGWGFGLFVVAVILFYAARPDVNKGHALSMPIFFMLTGGAGLMLASVCTWLYRVMP